MVCAKCSKSFANANESAKCSDCGLEFHASCCRLRTLAKLQAMISAKSLATWVCDDCRGRDDPTVLDLLKKIQQDMAQNSKSNDDNFATLKKSVNAVEQSLSNLKEKLTALENDNNNLKDQCKVLQDRNNKLDDRVFFLQSEVDDMQQYMRNRNLEFRGIPITHGEDVYNVLQAVARALDVTYNRHEISIAHRLPAPKNKKFHPSILAQFVSRTTRAQWMTAARAKKITAKDLAVSLPAVPVFVVEHLTAQNRSLLNYAKGAVSNQKLEFAWVKEGKVFVRKTKTSAAIRVRFEEDVNRVVNEHKVPT